MFSDCVSMIALHKLNPLAKTFIWGRDDDIDLHNKGSMVNTNAIGRALDCHLFGLCPDRNSCMAFVLIVTLVWPLS